jgi:hypothetical protein
MRRIIHHLRRKTEQERRDILHIWTVIFALLFFGLWIYSLGHNFSNKDTQKKIGEDLKPFSILKDNMVGGNTDASNPYVATPPQGE